MSQVGYEDFILGNKNDVAQTFNPFSSISMQMIFFSQGESA